MFKDDNIEIKNCKIYFEDCIEGMEKLKDNSVDLIIADPPFGLDFDGRKGNYNRDAEKVLKGYVEVSDVSYLRFCIDWLGNAKRVLRKNGTIYVFSCWNNLRDVLFAASYLGLHQQSMLTWSRTFPVYKRWNWVDAFYCIVMLLKKKPSKGRRPKYTFNKILTKNPKTGELRHYPRSDLRFPEEYHRGKVKNATKLPNALVRHLILTSSNEGDLILDPFLGNGTTAVEALKHDRKFIGFEINVLTKEVIENAIVEFS